MDSWYEQFSNYISLALSNNKKELYSFKNDPSVTYMLEHCTYNQGNNYLYVINNIKNRPFTKENIVEYCELNDKFGGGKKFDYKFIITSPSNFRYILHAYLILNHMKNLNLSDVNLVELGCGYGGLCLAVLYFSKFFNINITKYYCIDLPIISNLQKFYLSNFTIADNIVEFHSSYDYGKSINDKDLFLVSNYCFSEISKQNQYKYITNLFPKVSHGFMTWNAIPIYNFGFKISFEEEYPQTCESNPNKYVYF